MELKTFYAQWAGFPVPNATVTLYIAGTTDFAEGLETSTGAPLSNPFDADSQGRIEVSAPDGDYDMRIVAGGRLQQMRVRFIGSAFPRLAQPDGASLIGVPAGAGGNNVESFVGYTRTDIDPEAFPPASSPPPDEVVVRQGDEWVRATWSQIQSWIGGVTPPSNAVTIDGQPVTVQGELVTVG